jgi:hypothetical protein
MKISVGLNKTGNQKYLQGGESHAVANQCQGHSCQPNIRLSPLQWSGLTATPPSGKPEPQNRDYDLGILNHVYSGINRIAPHRTYVVCVAHN